MPTTSPLGHGQIRSFRMPADFWLRRADRCREQNLPLRAITILRHAMQLEPDDADLRLEYADELRSLDCYEASNRECYALLAKHPDCFSAFGLLSQNLLSLGQHGEAMDAYAFYAQYARMFPEDLPPWDDELYDVEDALADLPAPHGRARLQALLQAAGRRMERGDLEQARTLLERSVQKPFPRRMPQRDALCALYFHRVRQPGRARAFALRAVKTAPGLPSVLLPMAMLLFEAKQSAALPALLRAAAAARTPEDERGVCVVAAAMKRDEVALAMLERTLRHCPNRMSAAFDRCVFKLRSGDLAAANPSIHRLREIDPDDPYVEKLFLLVNRLAEESAAPQAVRRAGRELPFYGMPDQRVTAEALCLFYSALEKGVESFAARLGEDRGLYRAFLSLLRLDPMLHNLLPALCAAMPPLDGQTLLRHVLLQGMDDRQAVQDVCLLLQAYGLQPPFLVRFHQRLTLLDPSAQPPVTASFLQRMTNRRLQALCALPGGRAALPFALCVLPGLPEPALFKLAGDAYGVWPQALLYQYRKTMGMPPPRLDGDILATSGKRKAFLYACKAVKRAASQKKETKPYGADRR